MTIEFRELATAAELVVLPEFEKRIWGGNSEMVSVNVLVATISEGGMAIGAFDDSVLIGAVYGFATRDPHVLHSHYMAVDPAYRRLGLGATLKHRQRDWCLANGVTAMRWTYDPLQITNAHLNLRTLQAVGVGYHVNHYGDLGGINGSLPSDRVTVFWQLVDDRPAVTEHTTVDVPAVTVEQIAASSTEAHHARHVVRDAFTALFADGWRITDVDRVQRRYTFSR